MRRLLSALVVVAGCSAFGGGDVVFQATASAYQPGDTVTVRLANESGDGIGYNLCFSVLQRSDAGRWVIVDRSGTEDPQICTSILLGLEPGRSAESQLTVPSNAEAGAYRVETSVEVNGKNRAVTTGRFDVGTPASASAG